MIRSECILIDSIKSVLKYIHKTVENNVTYIEDLPRVEITKALSEFNGFSLKPSTIIIFAKHPDNTIFPINITNRFRKRYKKFTEKDFLPPEKQCPSIFISPK